MSGGEDLPNRLNDEQGSESAGPPQPVEPLYAPDRYCLRCQEPLPWYDEGPIFCPRCRFACDPNDPRTYRTRRTRVGWKFWFPGFALAVITGVFGYAACLQTGEVGLALFFAMPISLGAILGYGARLQTWLVLTAVVFVIGFLAAFAIAIITYRFYTTGVFETIVTAAMGGCILSVMVLAPACFGALLGIVLRAFLSSSRWDQRSFFPLVLLMLLPGAADLLRPARTRTMGVVECGARPGDACRFRLKRPQTPAARTATRLPVGRSSGCGR